LDNVVIKDNVTILGTKKIYSETKLLTTVCIHSGAIVGADGFGFAPNADGTLKKNSK
jgi:UDP-3-O-[3-hydroxymyristoyl] glucosamine N-acyltransferase